MSGTSTLSPTAKYDDQGIYVSLIVGGVLLVVFGGLMAFLYYTPILWLKRFYRPNHTIEPAPPPSARAPSAAAVAAAQRVLREAAPDESNLPIPEAVFAEHTVRPHGHNGRAVTRRKRLGISLPFLSTFFIRPTWQDWISIEEPSLRDRTDGALSPVHYRNPAPAPRHTSDRSFVPLQAPSSAYRLGRSGRAGREDAEGSGAALPSPVGAGTAAVAAAEVSSGGFSPRSAAAPQSYGAVEESPGRPHEPGTSADRAASATSLQPALPKTAVDPLVAVYLFTLKFFFSLMFLGEIFTVWIMLIAKKDNYMERTLIVRDLHNCSSFNDNETGCEMQKPFCYYHGDGLGCAVVPLHGLYDLTVLNIRPRSPRWMAVGLLNVGFCVVIVGLTLLYVRRVGQYVEAVMANQMRHALGYRVVCVRGLDSTDIRSEEAFRQAFLQLPVYFPNASPTSSSSPMPTTTHAASTTTTPTGGGGGASGGGGGGGGGGAGGNGSRSVFVEVDDNEEGYVVCGCSGLNCLFSIAGVQYYVVRRSDATFTEPDKVEQVLITRMPPFGMLESIAETESAMADLQEAIADEKALRRRLMLRYETQSCTTMRRRRHGGGGGASRRPPERTTSVLVSSDDGADVGVVATSTHGSPIDDGSDAVLMTRGPFPGCCDTVPAVPYYEAIFFRHAHDMNMALEQVPRQPVAGAAFVVFKDALCAFEFTQLFTARFGGLFSSLTATIAGPPGRIFQNSLTAGRCALWARFTLIFLLYVVLLFTWSVPISVLGSLEELSQVSKSPLLHRYAELPEWLRSLLNAYLPVGTLALLNIALPHLIRFLVRAMGAFNRAECDGGQLYMQYVFMVVTAVIFQAAFQGAMSRLTGLLKRADQSSLIDFFVSCISPSNGYFYAKVITATCLSTWVELLDPIGILMALLLRGGAHIQRNYDALFLPCELELPRLLSFDLMVLSMGLLFHMTAPLLGLLVVGYFLVRYWTQRTKHCDRYRPTLSPAHDCTDFGVPAQVIRCVMWLYCFAEVCGVLLMSLRDQRAGVVLCSLTLATGLTLTVYVYVKTRRWTASLANARRFARNAHHLHRQHPPAPSAPRPTATTPLRSCAQPSPPSTSAGPTAAAAAGGGGASIDGRAAASTSANASGSSQLYAGSDTAYEDQDDAAGQQRSADNRNSAVQEEGVLESYEHVTLNQVLFDTTRNPFLSHLLPRKPGVTMRYQPKHQRLATVDAAAEVRVMKETTFVVERYWDRGMTWFEADANGYWNLDNGADIGDDGDDGGDDGDDGDDGDAAALSYAHNDGDDAAHTREGEGHPAKPAPAVNGRRADVPPPAVSQSCTNGGRRTLAAVSMADLTGAAQQLLGRRHPTVVVTTATASPVAATHADVSSAWTNASASASAGTRTQDRSTASTPPVLPLRSTEEQRAESELEQSLLRQSVYPDSATTEPALTVHVADDARR
ncbi:hypothetical protein NESM_000417100 [Novymonas esmeraldas]|uniref:CSC1/OSCA1-like 7TM region domain-containing protein n=1 Tax=Novymonas esmeraldas TaxID=1808958 RepID=A0AAW0EN18_9TRYP